MTDRLARSLVPLALLALSAGGCGGKDKKNEDGDVDTMEEPDAVDTSTDTAPDTEPDVPVDTGPDAEPDTGPDAEPDATDVTADEESDCVPGTEGSPPSEALDACLEAMGCIAMPDIGLLGDFGEFCVLRSFFELYPLYMSAMEILGVGMFQAFFEEVDAHASCVAAATTCDALFECVNGGVPSPTCATPDPAWPVIGLTCASDVLSICVNTEAGTTNGRVFRHDCATDGLACASLGVMGAICGRTDCTAAGDPACVGDDIDWCMASGVHVVVDCDDAARSSGGTCGDVDPSTTTIEVGCVPSGSACDPTSDAAYCDAEDLVECNATFSRWVPVDCTAMGTGWSCNDSTDPPDCVPDTSGWTCTLPVTPACDCDDVIFCNPMTGTDLRVECPDYGYATCGDTDLATIDIEAGCID
jgi:hypothetical protein